MTETLKLPVLPLADSVVLPGMVVPVRLDQPEIQAAVDAAQQRRAQGPRSFPASTASTPPSARSPSSSRSAGSPTGSKAAVVRGESRAQIGSGVTGPGAALWVEVTPVEDAPVTGRATELAKEYKALVVGILQQRGRLAGDRLGAADHRPRSARRHRGLGLLPRPRAQGAAARRDRRGQAAGAAGRVDSRARGRAGGLREDLATTSARAWRRPSASSCCASSWPRSARSWARTSRRAPTTTAPGWSPPTCPSTCARPR